MPLVLVYITAADRTEAIAIGRALVEARLAACANIIDGAQSIYWWEGAVQEDAEAILIVKTKEELLGRATEMARSLHSYDCPDIVALPITGGHPAYLGWVAAETRTG